jgi:hypothetical protein
VPRQLTFNFPLWFSMRRALWKFNLHINNGK